MMVLEDDDMFDSLIAFLAKSNDKDDEVILLISRKFLIITL